MRVIEPGVILKERFFIRGVIGADPEGTIYKAVHTRLLENVSIKALAQHLPDSPNFYDQLSSNLRCHWALKTGQLGALENRPS